MIIKDAKKVLFSANGRINRLTYWTYNIPILIVQVLMNFAEEGMLPGVNNEIALLVFAVLALFTIWPALALGIKRCHDRDQSGWWMLLLLVPLVGPMILFVSLGFIKGTEGTNRYGRDPFVKYGIKG